MKTATAIDKFALSAPEVQKLRHGIIDCFGEVGTALAHKVWSEVSFVEAEFPQQVVTLNVSGHGGSVDAGRSIVDCCRCAQSDVKVVATGLVASMSAVIAICAAKPGNRYCTPGTTYMLHECLSGTQGRMSDIARTARHMEELQDAIEEMISSASGLSRKEVCDLCRHGDRYISACEAKRLGLVDYIIEWK